MDEASVDLGQWGEYKFAILDETVGNVELQGVKFHVIEEENIQINDSGSPSKSLRTSQSEFNGLQCSEEFGGFQVSLYFYDAVYKPVLGRIANGFRSKEGGFCQKLVTVSFEDF